MRIQRFFSLPTFADAGQMRWARVLRFIIWSLLLAFNAQLIVIFFLLPQYWTRWLAVILTLDLFAVLQFLANRSNRTALARAKDEIARREHVEVELGETEKRYREVFEATSDCIFLLDVTTEGRFLLYRFNPAIEKVFGVSSAEIVGKPPEQVLPPNEGRAVTANYQRCVDQGSPISYEEILTGAAGRSYYFHTTLIPVKNEEGRIFRIVGVAHDITKRKEAEAASRESEQRYREVFETTSDCIFLIDVTIDGRFLLNRYNPVAEKVVGLTTAEGVGMTTEEIFPAAQARQMIAHYKQCIAQGSPISYEEPITSVHGKSYYFYTTIIPVKDTEGRISRIVGVAHDITERKEAEAALRRSRDELEVRVQERTSELQKANKELQNLNRELEAFSHSVSHDLRRPLRAVTGFTEVLVSEYARDLPEEARNLLAITRDSALQMNQLIEALLRLSRIDRQPLVPRPVNLTALARQTAAELRSEQPERNMEISVADVPECLGDPAMLRQVFVNLLSNAIKFTADRPVALIEVGFKKENCDPFYFVRDNGVGFDMQYAGKLFGVFQRLHSGDKFSGTGVGLSIVRRIIHRHGGKIWAEAAVDQGATFYFTLPQVSSSKN